MKNPFDPIFSQGYKVAIWNIKYKMLDFLNRRLDLRRVIGNNKINGGIGKENCQ